MPEWTPRIVGGIKQKYAIQSGEWIISKTLHPEPKYTLWQGMMRIGTYATADEAKSNASKPLFMTGIENIE